MTTNRAPRLIRLLPSVALLGSVACLTPTLLHTEAVPVASAGVDAPRTLAPGEEALTKALADGSCWNSGEGHPYPTRVWVKVKWSGSGDVKYTEKGSRYTDMILADSSRWGEVAAFCR